MQIMVQNAKIFDLDSTSVHIHNPHTHKHIHVLYTHTHTHIIHSLQLQLSIIKIIIFVATVFFFVCNGLFFQHVCKNGKKAEIQNKKTKNLYYK